MNKTHFANPNDFIKHLKTRSDNRDTVILNISPYTPTGFYSSGTRIQGFFCDTAENPQDFYDHYIIDVKYGDLRSAKSVIKEIRTVSNNLGYYSY